MGFVQGRTHETLGDGVEIQCALREAPRILYGTGYAASRCGAGKRALSLKTQVFDINPLPGAQRHCPLEHVREFTDIARPVVLRSEEHTSELQSHSDLVCRLL